MSFCFKVKYHQTDLDCELNDQELICTGTVYKEFKQLRFIPNMTVSTKFRTKTVKGTLLYFTKQKAVISYNGKEKRDEISTFVDNNKMIEICFRIEKDGHGPYRSPDASESLLNWRKKLRESRKLQMEHGVLVQPAPEQDSSFSDYPHLGSYCFFAFKNYDQLFKWFTLEDIQFLVKEGFKIVSKQEGLDYYQSFHSYHQIAYAISEENYNKAIRRFY